MGFFDSLFAKWTHFVIRHRTAVAALFVCFSLALGAGISKLGLDFSAEELFGRDDLAHTQWRAHQKLWGPDDGIMLALVQSDKSLVQKEGLLELTKIAQAIENTPGVMSVVSIHNLALPQSGDAGVSFETLLNVPRSEKEILQDPILFPNFVSADTKAASMFIALDVRADDIIAVRGVVDKLEANLAPLRENKTITLAGRPVMRTRLLHHVLHDQFVFVPLSALFIAFFLWLLFRRFHGVFLPVIAAFLPAVLLMGVLGYFGQTIGIVNQVYFTLLPVIAASGGIHVLSRYYEEAHKSGIDRDTLLPTNRIDSLVRTFSSTGTPCFFSVLTTIVGLLSLQLSSMPVLRNFGIFSAIGMGLTFMVLMIVFPIILSATHGRVIDEERAQKQVRINRLLDTLANVSLQKPLMPIVMALLAMVALSVVARGVNVDNKLSAMAEDEAPVQKAHRFIDTHMGGVITLQVGAKGAPGAFAKPDALRALLALEKKLPSLSKDIRVVQGPSSLIKKANALLTQNDRLPSEGDLIEQLLFLVGDEDAFKAFMNDNYSAARILVQTRDMGAVAFHELELEVEALIAATQFPEGVQAYQTGTAGRSYGGILNLATDLRRAIFAAFFTILLIFVFIFRSLRIALLSVFPNALPLIAGYGLVAYMGWPLDPGPAVVFTVALGIAVDDSIHLIFRMREEQHSGKSLDDALAFSIVNSGRPVVITTIILCAGFMVNALSSFPTNARTGLLGAFVIFVALLADLFILPSMLALFGPRSENQSKG